MTRYFLAAAAATILVAACTPFNATDVAATASTSVASPSPSVPRIKSHKSGATELPAEINIPSSVGEVIFRHQAHFKDRAIGCVECHHQINARELKTPHPDYLKSSWVNCKVCHDGSGKTIQEVYACSECHPTNPINIADETLSAKVVIHKQCWKCHPVSTGKDASKDCEKCHSGKKAS